MSRLRKISVVVEKGNVVHYIDPSTVTALIAVTAAAIPSLGLEDYRGVVIKLSGDEPRAISLKGITPDAAHDLLFAPEFEHQEDAK